MIALIIAAITDDFENFHNYCAVILGTLPAEFAIEICIFEWLERRSMRNCKGNETEHYKPQY